MGSSRSIGDRSILREEQQGHGSLLPRLAWAQAELWHVMPVTDPSQELPAQPLWP